MLDLKPLAPRPSGIKPLAPKSGKLSPIDLRQVAVGVVSAFGAGVGANLVSGWVWRNVVEPRRRKKGKVKVKVLPNGMFAVEDKLDLLMEEEIQERVTTKRKYRIRLR